MKHDVTVVHLNIYCCSSLTYLDNKDGCQTPVQAACSMKRLCSYSTGPSALNCYFKYMGQTISIHSLFSVCILSVCILPVCIFSVCILPVCIFSVCIFSVCILPVCILSVCILPVCIFSVCILPVCIFSVCIFSVCILPVCILSVCILSVPQLGVEPDTCCRAALQPTAQQCCPST
uniref:Uncharacterized protein n=1 Tax=Amphilophus citrinellus TaxID=61819 RepID=A0A3Q0S0X6_AMPCI